MSSRLLLVQVAQLLRDQGITGETLVRLTAASVVESGPGPDADPNGPLYADWGQVNPGDADPPKWGPSFNFLQVRSLQPGRAELATYPHRDRAFLQASAVNGAKAVAAVLAEPGAGLHLWSSIDSGAYLPFMPAAKAAVSALGGTGVTPTAAEWFNVGPFPAVTPPPTASLVAGLSVYAPSELRLEGELLAARCDVLTAELDRTIDDTPRLIVTVLDQDNELLESGLLEQRSRESIDGILFELHGVARYRRDLTLTLIDAAAADLLNDVPTERIAQAPGTGSRGGFLRRLAGRHPWIQVDIETGADPLVELAVEVGENIFAAMGRIAADVGWRRCTVANRLLIGSEAWLASRTAPTTIREGQGGVDRIEFDFVSGEPASRAFVICDAALWAAPPSAAVVVDALGPASGEWLVVGGRKTLAKTQATIELGRVQPPLPEPLPPPEPDIREAGANGSPAYDPTGVILGGTVSARGFINPVPGGRRISKWGDCRSGLSCTTPCCRKHKGWDIAAAKGSPIVAPKDGRVTNIVTGTAGYGNAVYLAHDGDVSTIHAHCATIAVTRGQQVVQGQVIATVGDTGNAKGTPPHNHTEVRVGGAATNPEHWYPL